MSAPLPQDFLRQSIEKAMADLPALPNVVARVLEETEKPDATAAAIEKMIAADQALASKVLRVVNSAYYGLSGQVTSLGQAIVILGLPQIRNLVLSVSAMSTLKPKTARQQEVLKLFWMHSLATASCAGLIAKKKKLAGTDAETLFVASLLHDIGRLFLFCTFTQTYEQVLSFATERGVVVERAEAQLLGVNHGGIGAQIARQWHLPDTLVQLIDTHEGPFEKETAPINFALHYADQVTKYLYFPNSTPAPSACDEHATAWLDFTEEDNAWLLDETTKRLEEASSLFGLLAA